MMQLKWAIDGRISGDHSFNYSNCIFPMFILLNFAFFNKRFTAPFPPKSALFANSLRHFSTDYSNNEDGNNDNAVLSHLDSKSGDARMVDVGTKETSLERIALAQAVVQFPQGILAKLLQKGENPKGDIFAVRFLNTLIDFSTKVSRIAGILAAKSVPQLIPLCHQIPLTSVHIQFRIDLANDRVFVFCRVKVVQARTGVEMEAMVRMENEFTKDSHFLDRLFIGSAGNLRHDQVGNTWHSD